MPILKRKTASGWETVTAEWPTQIPVTEVQADLVPLTVTENGTYTPQAPHNGFSSVSVNVSGKNKQYCHMSYLDTLTTMTATGVLLRVAKTGTYTVRWIMLRSEASVSGTASQLYVNNVAYGSQQSSFGNPDNWTQLVTLNNVSLQAGNTCEVRVKSGSSWYSAGVFGLYIEEV